MVHEAWAQTTEEILGRDACFRDQQSMGAHAFTLKSLQSEMPKVLKMQANTPTLSEVKEKVGKELLRRSGLKAAAKAAPESVAMSSFSAEDAAGTGTLALANEPHEDEEDDDGQPLLKANKVGLRMRGSGRGRGHGARGGRVSRGSRPSGAQRRAVEKRGRMPKDPNGDSESDVVASPKRPSIRRGGSSASLGETAAMSDISLCVAAPSTRSPRGSKIPPLDRAHGYNIDRCHGPCSKAARISKGPFLKKDRLSDLCLQGRQSLADQRPSVMRA